MSQLREFLSPGKWASGFFYITQNGDPQNVGAKSAFLFEMESPPAHFGHFVFITFEHRDFCRLHIGRWRKADQSPQDDSVGMQPVFQSEFRFQIAPKLEPNLVDQTNLAYSNHSSLSKCY